MTNGNNVVNANQLAATATVIKNFTMAQVNSISNGEGFNGGGSAVLSSVPAYSEGSLWFTTVSGGLQLNCFHNGYTYSFNSFKRKKYVANLESGLLVWAQEVVANPSPGDSVDDAIANSWSNQYTVWRDDDSFTVGGADFTIDYHLTLTQGNGYAGVVILKPTNSFSDYSAEMHDMFSLYYSGGYTLYLTYGTNAIINGACCSGTDNHFEFDYFHSTNTLKVFVDGVLVNTFANTTISRLPRYLFLMGTPDGQNRTLGTATITNFRILDGTARHSENFTPPVFD